MKNIVILVALISSLNAWSVAPTNDDHMGDIAISSQEIEAFNMNQHGKIEAGILNHKRLLLDELILNASADMKLIGDKAAVILAEYKDLLKRLENADEADISYTEIQELNKEFEELTIEVDSIMTE